MKKEHFDLLSKIYPEEFNSIRFKNKELLKELSESDDEYSWEIRKKLRTNVEEMIKLLNGIK